MFKLSRSVFSGLLFLILLFPVSDGFSATSKDKPLGYVTLSFNATCKAMMRDSHEYVNDFYHESNKVNSVDDLTVTCQGTIKYKIVFIRGDGFMDVERDSGSCQYSGGGGGYISDSAMPDKISWKYKIINPHRPAVNEIFFYDDGGVEFLLHNFIGHEIGDIISCDSVDGYPMDAYYVAEMAVTDALHNERFKEQLVAKFDPKLKNWSASATATHEFDMSSEESGLRKATVTVNFTVTCGADPEESELEAVVIPPAGYSAWVPAAGVNENTPGKQLEVRVKLRNKKEPKKPPEEGAKFTFELQKTSKESGVCLNSPLQDAKDSYDLGINSKENPDLTVTGSQIAVTKGYVEESEVTIDCYDWAAYGVLKISAVTASGKTVPMVIQEQPGKELKIPLDQNDNRIADTWEKANGILAADSGSGWDNETQQGNRKNGDGLTLFEEYRGLIANGKHVRLHPDEKDLVIENRVGQLIKPGLSFFEKASGIKIIELRQGELVETRVVNLNSKYQHAGDQYGLRVLPGEFQHAFDLAAALPLRPHPSPKDCAEIALRQQYVNDFNDPSVIQKSKLEIQAAMTLAIAHEIAHALSVQHHGDEAEPAEVELGPNSDANVYDEKGRLIPKPFTVRGAIGGYRGPGSGDINCIMSYAPFYDWAHNRLEKTFRKVPRVSNGSIFCTSAKGTGINANGAYFGDAAGRGNCLGQMRVKAY